MSVKNILLGALVLGAFGCAKSDPNTAVTANAQEKYLLAGSWCSQEHPASGLKLYTVYNFSSIAGAFEPSLNVSHIVVTDSGEQHSYKNETSTPWAYQRANSTTGNLFQGYSIEVVTDKAKVSDLMTQETIHTSDQKPLKAVLNLYPDSILPPGLSSAVVHAFPCANVVDTSHSQARPIAELQILASNYLGTQDENKEFWNAVGLNLPVEEIPVTADALQAHGWCAWDSMRTSGTYRLGARILVFNANGAASTRQYYSFSGDATKTDDVRAFYSQLAQRATRFKYQVDPASKRAIVYNRVDRFEFPSVYKLVQGANGRRALFAVSSESPDTPVAVTPTDVYYDCADPAALAFENSWSQWLPQITQLQNDALK